MDEKDVPCLTARTRQLQRYLDRDDKKIFEDWDFLVRGADVGTN